MHAHPEQAKGEFVVVIGGAEKKVAKPLADYQSLLTILLQELSLKQAVSLACRITKGKRKILYALALQLTRK